MYNLVENFLHLFSEDQKTCENALLEKSTWILNSYFALFTLPIVVNDPAIDYQEFYALMDQALVFKESKDHQYVYYKFYSLSKRINEHQFGVLFDLAKLKENHKEYLALFANFFPCLTKEEIASIKDPFLHDFAMMMEGKEGEFVLILDKNQTFENKYYMPYMKLILINNKDSLTKEESSIIEDINDKLKVEIRSATNGLY